MGRLFKKHPLTVFRVVRNDQLPLPIGRSDRVSERLSGMAFMDMHDTTDKTSVGLVTIENYRSSVFTPGNCEFGEYVVFSVRMDERKIPGSALKLCVDTAMDSALDAAKEQGRNFVSRARKLEIKEQVKLRLLAKASPAPTIADVWWNTKTQMLYVTDKSSKMVEAARLMFESAYSDKYHLELVEAFPGEDHDRAATFLTGIWLNRPADIKFTTGDGEPVSVWAEEKVNIADNNEEVRAVTLADGMDGLKEIRMGIESGKRVVKAQLVFDSATLGQFSAVVSSVTIPSIETLSVPTITHHEAGEFDGALMTQIGNIEYAHGLLMSLIDGVESFRTLPMEEDQAA